MKLWNLLFCFLPTLVFANQIECINSFINPYVFKPKLGFNPVLLHARTKGFCAESAEGKFSCFSRMGDQVAVPKDFRKPSALDFEFWVFKGSNDDHTKEFNASVFCWIDLSHEMNCHSFVKITTAVTVNHKQEKRVIRFIETKKQNQLDGIRLKRFKSHFTFDDVMLVTEPLSSTSLYSESYSFVNVSITDKIFVAQAQAPIEDILEIVFLGSSHDDRKPFLLTTSLETLKYPYQYSRVGEIILDESGVVYLWGLPIKYTNPIRYLEPFSTSGHAVAIDIYGHPLNLDDLRNFLSGSSIDTEKMKFFDMNLNIVARKIAYSDRYYLLDYQGKVHELTHTLNQSVDHRYQVNPKPVFENAIDIAATKDVICVIKEKKK